MTGHMGSGRSTHSVILMSGQHLDNNGWITLAVSYIIWGTIVTALPLLGSTNAPSGLEDYNEMLEVDSMDDWVWIKIQVGLTKVNFVPLQ